MQRDQREGGAALCALHRDPWPARGVPAVPADHREGRWQIREEVPGHGNDRGEQSLHMLIT